MTAGARILNQPPKYFFPGIPELLQCRTGQGKKGSPVLYVSRLSRPRITHSLDVGKREESARPARGGRFFATSISAPVSILDEQDQEGKRKKRRKGEKKGRSCRSRRTPLSFGTAHRCATPHAGLSKKEGKKGGIDGGAKCSRAVLL